MPKHTSHANRGITSNIVFTLLAIMGVIGLAVGAYALFSTDSEFKGGPAPMENSKPVDAGVNLPLVQLDGQWAAENNGAKFLATIKDRTINIEFSANDTTMIYWYGTFVSQESPGNEYVSDAVEINKMVLSGAKSKTFIINDDSITFDFQAMGMTKKVVLTRG